MASLYTEELVLVVAVLVVEMVLVVLVVMVVVMVGLTKTLVHNIVVGQHI